MPQLRRDAPDVLYKFRGVKFFKRDLRALLTERSLYCAAPAHLNDPYDLRPRLVLPSEQEREAWIEETLTHYSEDERPIVRRNCIRLCKSARDRENYLNETMADELSKFGVVSFSCPILSPVLWAHYAEGHQGFAVGYRGRTAHELDAVPAFPVSYRNARAAYHPFGPPHDMLALVRTKSREWAYEREWRYVRLPTEGGPGLMRVPDKAIVEVWIGLRTSKWHEERILAAARRLPDRPRIYKTRMLPDRFELGRRQLK